MTTRRIDEIRTRRSNEVRLREGREKDKESLEHDTSMRISVEALTDVGLIRELNEDSYRVIAEKNAVVVCDGMGGHAAGEVASATAADTISDLVRGGLDAQSIHTALPLGEDWPEEAVHLAAAVRLANRRLYNEASRSHKLRGMGTTVVAALFRPGALITAHVGDSRVYRITGENIEQLTVDHSWVAELIESGQVRPEDVENFADKNVITRALGTRPGVQVDLGVHPVSDGEVYLLCSDGLCGYVSDSEIQRCVSTHGSDLKAAAGALIEAANAAGGLDNSTVALVRIDASGSEVPSGVESVTLPEETEEELAQLDQLLRSRYKDEEAVPEETTDGQTGKLSPELSATGTGHRAWQWYVLITLVALLTAVLLWPRWFGKRGIGTGDPATNPPGRQGFAQTTHEDSLALLFVAAGTADRAAFAFLDGVSQGTLHDLEFGLLVEPGSHTLTVIDSTGDTLFSRLLELKPRDTLDLVVQ